MKHYSDAYNQGKIAFSRGAEVHHNPYDEDNEPDRNWSWERGYNEASNEEEDFSDRYSLNAD